MFILHGRGEVVFGVFSVHMSSCEHKLSETFLYEPRLITAFVGSAKISDVLEIL